MREIKFRGLKEHGWVYGVGAISNDDGSYIVTNFFRANVFCVTVKPETVGQFTGLKDANGIEVYEGDIVKFTTHDVIGFVKFENLCFRVMATDGSHGLQGYEPIVIGNIYENPELLSGEL